METLGMIKCNVDAALKDNILAVGGIFRDTTGTILHSFSLNF
jgi:hypothetical protein